MRFQSADDARSAGELRASALRVNNRLTAILHLAKTLEERTSELRLDPPALAFIASKAAVAREALLAETTERGGDSSGEFTKVVWRVDALPAVGGEAVLESFARAVSAAAESVAVLEGALDGLRRVLLDDAQSLHDRISQRLADLAPHGEPAFLLRALDALETLPADAGEEDRVAELRAAARGVLDGREAWAQAGQLLEAVEQARLAARALWEAVPASPAAEEARAFHEADLRARIGAALGLPDVPAVLEALAESRERVEALRRRAGALSEGIAAVSRMREELAAMGLRRGLRDAFLRLSSEVLARIPDHVERDAPLPSVVADSAALREVAALDSLSRVSPLLEAWPACDAWLTLRGARDLPRRAAKEMAAIAKARAALRHREAFEPVLQRWAVLSTAGMPPATGEALAERLGHLARVEAKLVEYELPRALGVLRADRADLRSDAIRARVTRLAAGRRRPHATLLENLAGKLSAEVVEGPAAREVLAGLVERLLGPEPEVPAGEASPALQGVLAREAARRRVARIADLARDLHVPEAEALAAARALAGAQPREVLLDERCRVLVSMPEELADLDEIRKLRARIAAAVAGASDAERLFEEVRALVRAPKAGRSP